MNENSNDENLNLVECYHCAGTGQAYGHRDFTDARGRRRGEWGMLPCPTCNGSGKTTPQVRAKYERWRELQVEMRREADQRGVPMARVRREYAERGRNAESQTDTRVGSTPNPRQLDKEM
jgi:hypothetical protein